MSDRCGDGCRHDSVDTEMLRVKAKQITDVLIGCTFHQCLHILELSVGQVVAQGCQPHHYGKLCATFVDNVKTIARQYLKYLQDNNMPPQPAQTKVPKHLS